MKEFKRCTRLKDVPTTTSDRTKAPLGTCPASCCVCSEMMLQAAINKAVELRWLPTHCALDEYMANWNNLEACINAALSKNND